MTALMIPIDGRCLVFAIAMAAVIVIYAAQERH